MQFYLNFTPTKFTFEINHNDKIFLIGSCFSENITQLLAENKFKTYSNPNGILFNPSSIHSSLTNIINVAPCNDSLLIERNGVYYSYLHHSSINNTHKIKLIENINTELKLAHTFLKNSNYLIITLGSAYGYYHLQLNQTVANCHKQDASLFKKQLISLSQIITSYTQLIHSIKQFNPNIKIIFSVSPVKYLKDGVVENNISKSTLLLAIHELVAKNQNCFYFPAYELVNDDLRDYRFYKQDFAHPNDQAIAYIWEKFSYACFNEKTIEINKQINKLQSALNHHTIINQNGEAQKLNDFIELQKEKIKKLNPEIEF